MIDYNKLPDLTSVSLTAHSVFVASHDLKWSCFPLLYYCLLQNVNPLGKDSTCPAHSYIPRAQTVPGPWQTLIPLLEEQIHSFMYQTAIVEICTLWAPLKYPVQLLWWKARDFSPKAWFKPPPVLEPTGPSTFLHPNLSFPAVNWIE